MYYQKNFNRNKILKMLLLRLSNKFDMIEINFCIINVFKLRLCNILIGDNKIQIVIVLSIWS